MPKTVDRKLFQISSSDSFDQNFQISDEFNTPRHFALALNRQFKNNFFNSMGFAKGRIPI